MTNSGWGPFGRVFHRRVRHQNKRPEVAPPTHKARNIIVSLAASPETPVSYRYLSHPTPMRPSSALLFLAIAPLAAVNLSAQTRHRASVSLIDVAPGTDLVARTKTILRQGPGQTFEPMGTVEAGRLITVRSCEAGWCTIGGAGDYRYAPSSDIEPLDQWMAEAKARRHHVVRHRKHAKPVAASGMPASAAPVTRPSLEAPTTGAAHTPAAPMQPQPAVKSKRTANHSQKTPAPTPMMVSPSPVTPTAPNMSQPMAKPKP